MIPPALLLLVAIAAGDPTDATASRDLLAARAVFEKNLEAIRNKDREAYLSCYLKSPTLARTGYEGVELGFESLAAETARGGWPDSFEAQDLRLVHVRPGLVYGTYRVRAFVGAKENQGISERLFLETPEGWKIAVTTGFVAPPGTPPPPRALAGATLVDGRGGPRRARRGRGPAWGQDRLRGQRAHSARPAGGSPDPRRDGPVAEPGLVDAHVHFSQTGWADGRPDASTCASAFPTRRSGRPAQPSRAVLPLVPLLGRNRGLRCRRLPLDLGLRARAEADTLAPHVSAAGPLLSTRDHWLNLPAERQFIFLSDEKAAREGARYLVAQRTDAVKVWFIGGERPFEQMSPLVRAAGEEAAAAGVPLIVHATELRLAKEALRAGAKLLVHSVWDEAIDDEFVALARKNEAIYNPTLTVPGGMPASSTRCSRASSGGRRPQRLRGRGDPRRHREDAGAGQGARRP